jgi:hypothetical protein
MKRIMKTYPGINGQTATVEYDDDLWQEDDKGYAVPGYLDPDECVKEAFSIFSLGLDDEKAVKRLSHATYRRAKFAPCCTDYIMRTVRALRDVGGIWIGNYALLEGKGAVLAYTSDCPADIRAAWEKMHADDYIED